VHHIQGCDRNQTLLLPNSVDDYIGPDNPVRFIEAFVEQVDLRGAWLPAVELDHVKKLETVATLEYRVDEKENGLKSKFEIK
jgi:hypothetical protein